MPTQTQFMIHRWSSHRRGNRREGIENRRFSNAEVGRHVPFELVGKVASAGAMAEASDVEGGSGSRHDGQSIGQDEREREGRRVREGERVKGKKS